MKATAKLITAALLLGVSACDQNLVVEDLSDPDIARVFATGASIESTIRAGYQTVHNTIMNTNDQPGLETFGLESYSNLNNFNLGTRSAIPRQPINNVVGGTSVFSEYSGLMKEAWLISSAMRALDVLNKAGLSTGSPGRDLRARSFGYFVVGVCLGWTAILYDSASVVTPSTSVDSVPPLVGSKTLGEAALAMLDSSLALANNSAMVSIDALWLDNTQTFSVDQFRRLIRSYRARIRAGLSRTPADAAAIDWTKVIDDAENGIQADYMVNVGGGTGWNLGYMSTRYQDATWSEMSMMYMGMADTSGGYRTFIAADYSHKDGRFLLRTPDLRWPSGDTRAAQNASSVAAVSATTRPYIENRDISLDPSGDGWGVSNYTYSRWRYIRANNNQGLYPEFMKAENDLLAAEGYIRKGDIPKAAAKIDLTRVARGGLPPLTGAVTTATDPVPGGNACVPLVPTGTGDVACGTIFEAMKYEKRIETTYTGFARFWIDSRGWGDLIATTPLELPIPYQEMQTRQRPYYLLGPGFGSAAPKGAYGF